MENIVPRWEWRTFGQTFGIAESRFAALPAEKVQSSEELYLVAAVSDANVKIRNQLLDIKLLERVDSNGLEQWRPVLKEPFPLTAPAIAQVCAALGVPDFPQTGDKMSLERLVGELAGPGGAIRAVSVKKTRTRYHVQGCIAELTDVIADGNKVRTTAMEDTDPAKVMAAVFAMGLDGYANTSYPRGLRQVIGLSNQGMHR